MGLLEGILLTIVTAATPLLIAALGELVAERSGVLNLGVEGMMTVGAMAGFAVAFMTGSPALGVAAAIVAGMAASAIFAVVTLGFAANQVAAGLALTIFGIGLAAVLGEGFANTPGPRIGPVDLGPLTDIPVVGRLLFGQDPLTYFAIALTVGVWWFLFRTRAGLVLRAVGDNHTSAHALGYQVIRVRFLAVLFGGGCAGLAGAFLTLVYTPQWLPTVVAGRGWIALALVVFATWRPGRVAIGALLFGGVSILQLHAQTLGIGLPSQFLSALPYLATVLVLVLISGNRGFLRLNTPASLGQPFVPDR